MRSLIVCFAAGTAFLQMQVELPVLNEYWPALPLVLAILLGLRTRIDEERRLSRCLTALLCAMLCFLCGYWWAAKLAEERLADALPMAWEGADIRVVGVVAQLPQSYERSLRFEFDVERVLTPQAFVPAHIVLSWWGTPLQDGQSGSIPALRPGERWQLTVRLRRPHGLHNPNGFDYEAWLLERDIRATGYVRAPVTAQRLAGLVMRPQYLVERVRERVRGKIADALPGAPYAGVLTALAIGEQKAISPELWQVFTRTGVNHLMSISGLHVTMIAGLFFWIAQFLWSRNSRLMLMWPARKVAVLAGLSAAIAYAWLAGFAVPAQRTVYMLAIVAIALWSGRLTVPSVALCAALLVVLLLDPWAVLSAGFWLSFGAVGVILFVASHRIGVPHWLLAWGRVQWAITLGLTPLLVAFFQQISLISPLANALAIPVVSLAVVPMTLLGVVVPGSTILQMAHGLMAACVGALAWMAQQESAVWQQHAPPLWTVGAAIAGIIWILLPRGFPARWIGVGALVPLFTVLPPRLPEGSMRVGVLDVGQGLAVVIETRNHTLLYDAGPAYGPQADSGNRVIVPYLRAGGVSVLDTLLISHGDQDHAGGASSVAQAMPVRRVLSSLADVATAGVSPLNAMRCVDGQRWRWDAVDFEILHPSTAHYAREKIRGNDRSCVLRVTAGGESILLAADIEQKTERELMAGAWDKLPARLLLVPHHGSRTSSSPEFIARVNPQNAIIAAGYRNRFGHPKDDVVERYRALGSRIYRTDLDGALIITMSAEGELNIQRGRVLRRRYWHDALENPDLIDDEESLHGDVSG